MSAAASAGSRFGDGWGRATVAAALRRDTWSVALWVILAALFVITKLISPDYGPRQLVSLAVSVLPIALAAVGQAIVVISGGIDLSVGSMMALTNVTAAVLMKDSGEAGAVVVVLGVILMGAGLGLVNGLLVVFSRVPDIVVTLAMSYVWAGCALLVLGTPGGGSASWFTELGRGTLLVEVLPKSLVLLAVVVGVVWIPLRGSRLGLSLYAVGSNRLAAFRSGVNVTGTRVAAYVLTGLFSGLGGLALTMNTGIGTPTPGPYTLLAVAAIVLGGVSLAGGRGGIVGPIVAVAILALIRTDLILLSVDANLTTVIQGVIMVGVVMVGAYLTLRRRRA